MQAYALSHVFPHRVFSRDIIKAWITPYTLQVHDRVITRHIIPIFSHRVFKGIYAHVDLKMDSIKRGSVTISLFDLIK